MTTTTKFIRTAPAPRYEVRVTRAGVTRATVLDAVATAQTIHDAVRLGYDVSRRRLADDEPARPGVWEVPS